MTSEFPLLSAVLEQSLGPLPPAGDISRVLGALGIADSSYHSFEPPCTPDPSPADAQTPQSQSVTMQMTADVYAVEPAYAGAIDRQPPPATPARLEPGLHEAPGDAPVWTTPTLGMSTVGMPTRTEPRVTAQAAPAPLMHAMAEDAANTAAWSRNPAAPQHADTRAANRVPPPDSDNTAGGLRPIKQPLSLSGLFRILGSPAQTPTASSRTLRDVFGYASKRNS